MTARDAKTTIDYGEIRHWTEERGGKPATVRGIGDDEEAGVLRIACISGLSGWQCASPFGSVVRGSLGLPSGLPAATLAGRVSPI